ncbi:MAG: alpha/beta hydrolase [Bacteroidetes bacterium]|nr:alpha/beta hydrolase [Bacteroidota bacterium]
MKKQHILLIALAAVIITPLVLWGHRDIPLEVLKQKYANADSRFISIEGMPVHYRVEGNMADSIPLLLLHGTGASLHTWDGWVDRMKSSKKIIRLDLPAFGLTGPAPSREYTPEMFQRVVIALLDSLNVHLVDIAGNSLGGRIAWYTTLRHPDRVRKLILIDAVGYPMQQGNQPLAFRLATIPILNKVLTFITPRSVVKSTLLNLYSDDTKVTDDLVDRYFELALRPGNRQAFIDRARPYDGDSAYTRIPRIKQPTLILWGEEDYFVPISMARQFERDLPNDTLVAVPHCGHMPMEELPDETSALVLDFLNK